MVVCDQSWLELADIRSKKYDEQDWVQVYGFKFGAEHSSFPEIGHYEEFQEFRGAVIFNRFKAEAEKITSWNTWSNDGLYPNYSDENPLLETHQFIDAKENRIGFRLAVSRFLSNDVPAQVHLYQDFPLVFGLELDRKMTWIRSPNEHEQVVKYIFDSKQEIQRVDIRVSYLKEYLKLRDTFFRLYYYSGRHFDQKYKPDI